MNIMARAKSPGIQTRDILGVAVTPAPWDEALAMVSRLLAEKHTTRVTFLNAHNANLACRDPEFASIINDFLVLPDGVGVDLGSMILHGRKFPANLNGTDFIPAILESADRPLTVGLLGARAQNVNEAARRMAARYRRHTFEVISDGYFPAADEPAILDRLANLSPDMLLVAMGVPHQEKWIARNITPRHATLVFAVGALLDFQSGAIARAPGWMRTLRIEWIYRLWLEPSRMWRRYILGNPEFLIRIVRQKLTGRSGFLGSEGVSRR